MFVARTFYGAFLSRNQQSCNDSAIPTLRNLSTYYCCIVLTTREFAGHYPTGATTRKKRNGIFTSGDTTHQNRSVRNVLTQTPVAKRRQNLTNLFVPKTGWSNRRDSNSQHSAWRADALPVELLLHCDESGILQCKRIMPRKEVNVSHITGNGTHFACRSRLCTGLAFGGKCGIRTHVGVNPSGFQDRLVMTASITFHIGELY